ncbi:MAG TPA: type I glyceraldehyde-3-phosphate dehydrogenase [Candidatus Saccharimonadales bacterium]|nr:type I glyceraldehyde-3-phosphate dehydrogenase [Candidatus Saccharimonadales bacterium]
MTKVAINGFGRIGRTSARIIFDKHPELELVAINDLTDNKTLAHLLQYDTQYRDFDKKVTYDDEHLIIGDKKVRSYAEKDPSKLPWKEQQIDVVLECTGRFTDAESAHGHIVAGAKRVIISAPAKGEMGTFVIGVNDDKLGGEEVISNASCTTNCIVPVAEVMHRHFGIAKAMMTTIHSYTADQNLQDGPHKDLRRARAAAENIVPTSTGAAKAAFLVIPELKGIFDGLSLRVPTPVVSLSDFTILTKKKTSVEEINQAFKEAAAEPRYKGVLEVTDKELVSSDFIGNPASSIIDLGLTQVIDGDFVKVVAWYDNEFGYSNRLVELAAKVGQ